MDTARNVFVLELAGLHREKVFKRLCKLLSRLRSKTGDDVVFVALLGEALARWSATAIKKEDFMQLLLVAAGTGRELFGEEVDTKKNTTTEIKSRTIGNC